MLVWQSWRAWRGARAVALLAAVALAAGIGSATAIYTVVNAVMLKPLPYRDGDRFMALFGGALNDPGRLSSLSYRDAEIYGERTRSFDVFGWYREAGKNLYFAGEPHHIQGVAVTPSLVGHLGIEPMLGTWFHDESGAVIASSLWRRLGSDPEIVGKRLTLDGRTFVVAGVMPPSFRLPVGGVTSAGVGAEIWIPLAREDAGAVYFAYGRRRPGVTAALAEEDVKRVAAEIAAEDPANHPAYTAVLFDLREAIIKEVRPTLLLLFAAAGLLFLITCANAAGLLLARAVSRSRETAIRVAMGASRRQLALQYFVEGLLVALPGAAGGLLLSVSMTPALAAMAEAHLPRADEIAVDWTVLLFALVAAVLASALASLAPLWQAARTAPATVLADGARASASSRTLRLSRSLVVAEVALAFALLAVSAFLIGHLRHLSRTSPGFEADNLLTFVLSVPGAIARDGDRRVGFQLRILDAVQGIPGVEAAAFANQLPLDGCCLGSSIYPENRPLDLKESQRTSLMAVSAEYFRAMRIPLRGGRLLSHSNHRQEIIDVVLSQAAVRRYWGDENPVGSYGRFNNPTGPRFQVVGVVGDVKNDGLGNPSVPEIYLASSIPAVETMHFVVRSPRPAASLVPEIRRAVADVDPQQPIHGVATMADIIDGSMTLQRVAALMTAFFAAAALLLATLGIYGVVSYAVRQRTVEIGTRIALGASRRSVLSLVVGDGLRMAFYGVAAGGIAALAAALYLGGVFRAGAPGPAPFLYSTAIVAAVAFTASFVPASRAAVVSPMVAIRDQSESMWQTARRQMGRAWDQLSDDGERGAAPLGALIGEFAEAVRGAATFPDAVQTALASLRERVGAASIRLLERSSADTFADDRCAIPAGGVLVNRLRGYPHPLPLAQGDFDTWKKWARGFRRDYAAEIEALEQAGARIAVPLRTRNEIVGILLLAAPIGRARYTRAELEMLQSSSEVFALLIENARLNERALEQEKLRRDLALAAEVQRRLLPAQPPRCERATLAPFTLPARVVGGDYYDFLELPQARLGIALADVAGKGIAAALLMSVVQASLRLIAAERDVTVPQLAARMNSALYRATATNRYATFFYAQFDGDGRRLHYVNAGHNPPLLARRTTDGVDIVELSAGGTVLGLFPETAYEQGQMQLCSGDLLVAFTDGLTEALDLAGEEFGEARLRALLRDAVGHSAEEVSARLAAAAREWIGAAEQHDDLTFVVLAVK